jgi:RNA polymerase sigma-70 factor (ECF subfamily)
MEMASFDADYINRLIAGDSEIERHFAMYFGELLGFKLRTRVRSPQLMEDIRQETLLRVLQKIRGGALQHPEALGAYVNGVSNLVMLESFRSESRTCEIADEGSAMIDPKGGAHEEFVTRERKEQVDEILRNLPEKDRELLKAVFLEEQDKDEVCRRFGVNRGYLRVLLHRARTKFRTGFSDNYPGAPRPK